MGPRHKSSLNKLKFSTFFLLKSYHFILNTYELDIINVELGAGSDLAIVWSQPAFELTSGCLHPIGRRGKSLIMHKWAPICHT